MNLLNEYLNGVIDGSIDTPPSGHILYLFCNSGFIAASDSRKKLNDLGDLRVNNLATNGYSVMPLDFVIDEAYFI
jgi:hypothetical protein